MQRQRKPSELLKALKRTAKTIVTTSFANSSTELKALLLLVLLNIKNPNSFGSISSLYHVWNHDAEVTFEKLLMSVKGKFPGCWNSFLLLNEQRKVFQVNAPEHFFHNVNLTFQNSIIDNHESKWVQLKTFFFNFALENKMKFSFRWSLSP